MEFRIDMIHVGENDRGILRTWVWQTDGKEWETETSSFPDGIPPLDWKSAPVAIAPGLGLYMQITRIL